MTSRQCTFQYASTGTAFSNKTFSVLVHDKASGIIRQLSRTGLSRAW